jgi:FtsP/CotA-like multicopper oxidase with cupredoxin domain
MMTIMTHHTRNSATIPAISRRRFVQGIAVAGAWASIGWPFRQVLAATNAPLMSGVDFSLEIGPVPVNITGRPRTAIGVNGMTPAPILRWREGDTVTLAVTNRLREPTSIHWHGVRVRGRDKNCA